MRWNDINLLLLLLVLMRKFCVWIMLNANFHFAERVQDRRSSSVSSKETLLSARNDARMLNIAIVKLVASAEGKL